MAERIVIGPFDRGLSTDRTPFMIDNDSFPTLVNAYQWRGRVKRKRGTKLLGRANRFIGTTDGSGNITVTLNTNTNPVHIQSGISQFVIGTDIFQDIGSGTLITNGSGSGSLNLTTTVLTITGSKHNTNVFYYPDLPILGLEELVLQAQQFPQTLAFDQNYSYQILNTSPYTIYDVGFFNNPSSATINGHAYTQKTTWTQVTWSGHDYDQFWTNNYAGAIFATNGNPGMQFQIPTSITYSSATQLTIVVPANTNLVKGDWIFINEVTGTASNRLNQQTGFIDSNPVTSMGSTTFTATFPFANFANHAFANGMVQYLTNYAPTSPGDGIRWYNGDPTNGGTYPPAVTGVGWVNFAPPLSQGSFSIDIYPAAQYYLVGAKLIYAYRGFLLFFAPYIQTSSGTPILLQDTVIFSQTGTPFYTASYDITTTPIVYHSLLVPNQQTATPQTFWEDVTGFGGYISSGVAQQIQTVVPNEDVLIIGYPKAFTRLIYTGNNLIPFLFYRINTELGAGSTFSSIIFDQGSFTLGNFGFVECGQVSAKRIDIPIPDAAFQVSYQNNGAQRVCAARDYVNEWTYTTYCSNEVRWKFPNQTLQYNYRDNSWAVFNECYTTYGTFSRQSGETWATLPYKSWSTWNDPWDAGESTLDMPQVIGGNQQGFILFRGEGTEEDDSGYIQNINTSTGAITSPFHGLNASDPDSGAQNYIMISGVQGTVGSQLNGKVFTVQVIDANTFSTRPSISGGTYLGGGTFTRFYVPFIQTKQFPVSWALARKTRLGTQMYLFTTTPNAQITLNMYLSQDGSTPYNNPSTNKAVVYSQVLYTCQESTNLGLTPANASLMEITQISSDNSASTSQEQIWHRMNTSLIGDTVQVGFTLSNAQMTALTSDSALFTITGATNAFPCVLTFSSNPSFAVGNVINISGVGGMTQLIGNYQVTRVSSNRVTINIDSTYFGTYTSGGTAFSVAPINQTAEIELHGMVLEVSPSQLLA